MASQPGGLQPGGPPTDQSPPLCDCPDASQTTHGYHFSGRMGCRQVLHRQCRPQKTARVGKLGAYPTNPGRAAAPLFQDPPCRAPNVGALSLVAEPITGNRRRHQRQAPALSPPTLERTAAQNLARRAYHAGLCHPATRLQLDISYPACPAFPPPAQILDSSSRVRFLCSFDRTTSAGRRDYAIALCFSELALRAKWPH